MSSPQPDPYGEVVDARLQTPDGRTLGWTAVGPSDGVTLVRLPGTPGCRWTGLRADRTVWRQRRLRVITTERPGFGVSSPVARRSFRGHADDLALVLDQLAIERVHIWAVNGGAPHALAFAAAHPQRVRAIAVIGGTVPCQGEPAGRDQLTEVLTPLAQAMRADPIAAVQAVLASAPDEDRAAMADPEWQRTFLRAAQESLAQGPAGWIDEAVLLNTAWAEIDPRVVSAPVTWHHPADDAQLPAVRRLVDELADGRVLPMDGGGAVALLRREPQILDELLSR